MKKTLYDLFELKSDATQADIDRAHEAVLARLQRDVQPGNPEAMNQSRLLHEGYRILSDPVRRCKYDASIEAATRAERTQIIYLSEDVSRKRGWGLGAIATVLILVLGAGWGYQQLQIRAEEIRAEHKAAVERIRAEKEKPVGIQFHPPGAPDTRQKIEPPAGKP